MIHHVMAPVIKIWDVAQAIRDNHYFEYSDMPDLRDILFGTYDNDCYKRFWLDYDDPEATDIEDEVREMLKKQFPKYAYVLIDVSW